MKKELANFVIGVDGGGTETVAALADLRGKILRIGRAGSSNPRNIGVERAAENIALAIRQVLKGKRRRIVSTFIGLPAFQEEFGVRQAEIEKLLIDQKGISLILQGKITIGSDQLVAFRAGTKEQNGVLLIAGTGCVAYGWHGFNKVKTSGWGWLADEGGAFWVGQKVFQAILRELDGRGFKTLMTKIAFQNLQIESKEALLTKVYSQPTEIVPLLSILCDKAAKKGDKVAKEIFFQAAKELILDAKIVIRKLNFRNQKFPLVLVGGMFKSNIVLNLVKKEIKKFARQVKFINVSKKQGVAGAVRLAIEMLND